MTDPSQPTTSTTQSDQIKALVASIVREGLKGQAIPVVLHGYVNGNNGEIIASLLAAAVASGWSMFMAYGRPIILAKLEVWRAQAMAQAASMRSHGVPPPTPEAVAQHSDKVTAADVVKVIAAAPK